MRKIEGRFTSIRNRSAEEILKGTKITNGISKCDCKFGEFKYIFSAYSYLSKEFYDKFSKKDFLESDIDKLKQFEEKFLIPIKNQVYDKINNIDLTSRKLIVCKIVNDCKDFKYFTHAFFKKYNEKKFKERDINKFIIFCNHLHSAIFQILNQHYKNTSKNTHKEIAVEYHQDGQFGYNELFRDSKIDNNDYIFYNNMITKSFSGFLDTFDSITRNCIQTIYFEMSYFLKSKITMDNNFIFLITQDIVRNTGEIIIRYYLIDKITYEHKNYSFLFNGDSEILDIDNVVMLRLYNNKLFILHVRDEKLKMKTVNIMKPSEQGTQTCNTKRKIIRKNIDADIIDNIIYVTNKFEDSKYCELEIFMFNPKKKMKFLGEKYLNLKNIKYKNELTTFELNYKYFFIKGDLFYIHLFVKKLGLLVMAEFSIKEEKLIKLIELPKEHYLGKPSKKISHDNRFVFSKERGTKNVVYELMKTQ